MELRTLHDQHIPSQIGQIQCMHRLPQTLGEHLDAGCRQAHRYRFGQSGIGQNQIGIHDVPQRAPILPTPVPTPMFKTLTGRGSTSNDF